MKIAMKELNDVVTSKINLMVTDGTVEKMISDRLEITIKECIDSAMKSYSDFGQTIQDKIKESINCGAKDIEIPAYNKFIRDIVVNKFTEILQENSATHLAELISDSIPPITKKEKISTLLHFIEQQWAELALEKGIEEIEIDADESGDSTALYVTFIKPDYNDKILVTFYNFRGEGWHIGYINEREHCLTGKPTNSASTYMDTVTARLFQYYAMGTLFEMDEEIESIYVSHH